MHSADQMLCVSSADYPSLSRQCYTELPLL